MKNTVDASVVAVWWKGDIAAKTLTPMPDYPIEVSLQQWLEAAFFTIVLVKARGRAGAPADERTPGTASMELDDEVEFYVATVEVEARTFGARATLKAELGSMSATCNAVVTRDEETPNLRICFADEEAGSSRAIVVTEEAQRVMKIMGRHPAMQRYLGPAPEFPHQERPLTQAILAEILAGEATRMVMEKKYPLGRADELDGAAMYAEHMRYMKKYLTRCHRALVPSVLD